jgi:hypothetical protein
LSLTLIVGSIYTLLNTDADIGVDLYIAVLPQHARVLLQLLLLGLLLLAQQLISACTCSLFF